MNDLGKQPSSPDTNPPPASDARALAADTLPPAGRTLLQTCPHCGKAQYPPREACRHCLADDLVWREYKNGGRLLAETILHHSNQPYFRERTPWRIGVVQLEAGPSVIAHVHAACPPPPVAVVVETVLDHENRAVLFAMPPGDVGARPEDRRLTEFIEHRQTRRGGVPHDAGNSTT